MEEEIYDEAMPLGVRARWVVHYSGLREASDEDITVVRRYVFELEDQLKFVEREIEYYRSFLLKERQKRGL